MKKILKTIIILVLLMPVLLYASTYDESKTKAKRFITTDYSDTYQRYLIDAGSKASNLPWSFNTSDNNEYNQGSIAYGGMLTKEEYESSLKGNSRSYLFDGKQYWSMSTTSEGHYVVGLGKGLNNGSSTPATKVTEYVLHDTKVTGKGTIDNPWIFVPKYSLIVTGEGGEVKPVGGRIGSSVVVNGVNDAVTFELTPESGKNYLYNTCGLITSPETSTEINNTGKITFRGINKDIACKIVFGKGLFELTIEQVNNTEEQIKISSNPTKLYVRNSEQFYRDEDGKNPIAKLDSLTAEKRGSAFDGLYYNMPGGGKIKVVDATGKIDKLSAKSITSNATLVPEWKPQKVTITLNGNGGKWGSETTKNLELTYGEPYGEFAKPIFTGYTFDGWYTAASGGTEVKSTDICKEVSNIPLFAHWRAKELTVTYNAHGGSVNPLSKTVIYGNKYGTLATPVYGGYKFNGWFTQSSEGTKITSENTVTNAENHSIHAQWDKCTNNVTGVKTWDTSVECKISSCEVGYRLSSNKCVRNRVTIKYKVNSGETLSGGSAYSINSDRFVTKNGNVFTTSAYYGEQIGSSGLADYNNASYINILKPGYRGVSGSEWVNVSNPSKKYSQATNYSVNNFCDASSDDCEVSLQVNWEKCTNNDSNVASWKPNNNCEIDTCKTGYYKNGNSCVITSYSITYNLNGGTNPSGAKTSYTIETETFDLPTPTRDNYIFEGWYTSSTFSGSKVTKITKGTTGNKTYYAKWSASVLTMQDWNGCDDLGYFEFITLVDSRDNQTYGVTKWSDGRCWMTENLRLEFDKLKENISTSNTNNPSSSFITQANKKPVSGFSCYGDNCMTKFQYFTGNMYSDELVGKSYGSDASLMAQSLIYTLDPSVVDVDYDDIDTYIERIEKAIEYYDAREYTAYMYGPLYNYYVASAGTLNTSTTEPSEVSGDICPKGWHMPSAPNNRDWGEWKIINNHFAGAGLERYPFMLLPAGRYHSSGSNFVLDSTYASLCYYYWSRSSTYVSAWRMGAWTSFVSGIPGGDIGFAIRCVKK